MDLFLQKKPTGGAPGGVQKYVLAIFGFFENHVLTSGDQILQARKTFINQKISILQLSFTSVVSDLI